MKIQRRGEDERRVNANAFVGSIRETSREGPGCCRASGKREGACKLIIAN